MHALYNEIEPFAADWLERLLAAGEIPEGRVDRRSIRELGADDVRAYRQFHAFAGIAGWAAALRMAEWPADLPVWTGSCPCQPFSAAGARAGFKDERHLWPEWFRLIRECRPPIVFGEQVASGDALRWFDAVCLDLEGEGYACGAADLCAAGVGAPHARQRLYFVALADGVLGRQGRADARGRHRGSVASTGPGPRRHAGLLAVAQRGGSPARRAGQAGHRPPAQPDRLGAVGGVALSPGQRRDGEHALLRTEAGGCATAVVEAAGGGPVGGMADSDAARLEVVGVESARHQRTPTQRSGAAGDVAHAHGGDSTNGGVQPGGGHALVAPDAAVGGWSDLEWIPCLDGKARPTRPGLFPLADGIPGRVGRLRAYGNAIVPQVAARFIRAVMDVLE